jgi:hypothetical protein
MGIAQTEVTGGWRKLQNEELHIYLAANIVMMM